MHLRPIILALAIAAVPPGASAQPASAGPAGTAPAKTPGQEKTGDAAVDCRKDLANARQAQREGHITQKEYAEQKKMAETKLKRDSGKTAPSPQAGCE